MVGTPARADHDPVREIRQHEEKQEKGDFQAPFARRLRGHDRYPIIVFQPC
jgi:hypothetical protein